MLKIKSMILMILTFMVIPLLMSCHSNAHHSNGDKVYLNGKWYFIADSINYDSKGNMIHSREKDGLEYWDVMIVKVI